MSEVTIPGRSINSTINSMKSLGSIGTQVLNDHGIDIVDLEKYYPVKIRSAIHEEILNRFGPISIEICGFQGLDSFRDFERSIKEKYSNLLNEIEEINNGQPLTYFEALTAAFFYGCKKYKDNLVIAEFGLFGRGDAVNILKKNLCNIVTSCSEDHLDWLPKNDRTIERIIFEKTSSLLNSNIVVAKQNSNEIVECIKKNISDNSANKYFFNENYNFVLKENNFFYYEDKYGGLKIPRPLSLFFVLTVSFLSLLTLKSLLGKSLAEASLFLGVTISLTLPYLVLSCSDDSCFSFNSFLLELFDVLFSTSVFS